MGNKVVNDVSNSTIRNPNSALPEGWWWVRLGEVCQFEYGTGLPEHDRQKGNVPVYGSNGIVGYHSVSITEGPAIVIGRKGSIGQAHYSSVACWPIDTTYYVDASKTSCDLQWLFFLIKWMRLDAFNRATGVPGLNRNDAYSQVISLPPLLEQKRVAAKVQELMKDIEYACTACEVQLEAAKTLPSSYLRQVFESEEAKKWERTRLGEVGPVRDGDWILNTDYRPSGVRLLQVGDVGLGRFVGKSSRFIGMERANELNCTFLEPGDILISRMPDPIGRACLLPDLGYPCITAVDVSIWRPRLDKADRQYLTYYLSCSEWISRVGAFASGATRARISRSNLEALEVPLPPLPEQKRIAAELKDKMAYAEKLKASIEKQLETIKALPQAILREAFLGEL